MPWSSFFKCWVLSQIFHSPLSFSSRGSLVSLHFLPLRWCYLHIWGYWYFSQQSGYHLVLNPAWHFTLCTLHQFSSVQSLSCVQFFAASWTAACQASLSKTNSRSLPKLMSIESVMPSRLLIPSSSSPTAPSPSQHQDIFQWVNSSHEVAKVLEFQL